MLLTISRRNTYLLSTFTPKTVVWYIIVPSKRHGGIEYLITEGT